MPAHDMRSTMQQALQGVWHGLPHVEVIYACAMLIREGLHSIMQKGWQHLKAGSAVPYSNHLLQR